MYLRLLRKSLLFLVAIFLIIAVATIATYFYVAPDLPSTATIRQIQVQTPLRVYSQDEKLIATFGDKRRIPITLEQMPQDMINAFLAAEDDRFYQHPGIDLAGLIRAAINLIRTGERTQGGSTITMQLARNFFLTKQRTFERKIKEIFLALIIERVFTKDEILNLYLNKIFLGHRAYGVEAAAEVYYGKTAKQLDLAQIAMIAGLPKAPSLYNPISNPDKAIARREYVLDRMLELGMIDQTIYARTKSTPVSAKRHSLNIELRAPYVAEMVRKHIVKEYGNDAYTKGFKVYTSVDSRLQNSANKSLREGLLKYDKRHGWRGAEEQLNPLADDFAMQTEQALARLQLIGDLIPAVVTQVDQTEMHLTLKDGKQITLDKPAWQWARPFIDEDKRGDTPQSAITVASTGAVVRIAMDDETPRLAQVPKAAGALVAMNTQTGAIYALTGGFDFYQSKFNRATQAKRQPGSSFKPFIYSAALSNGYTPASVIIDTPVVIVDTHYDWRPENYSGKFFGPTRLREALKHSRNLISVKLVDDIGIDETLDFIRRFGFERKEHPHNMTLALGSGTVRPLDLARAYAVFPNGGFFVDHYIIEKIMVGGEAIYQAQSLALCNEDCAKPTEDKPSASAPAYARRAIPADIAYQMTSMMKDVIRAGTGRRARALRRADIGGKTGTTNEQRDAWFSGFNRDIVSTVWVGFDDHSPLGDRETGSAVALPIWIDFMRTALEDRPAQNYFKPTNIVTAKIDRKTGLLAHPTDSKAVIETFRREYLPTQIAKPDKQNTSPKTDIKKLF